MIVPIQHFHSIRVDKTSKSGNHLGNVGDIVNYNGKIWLSQKVDSLRIEEDVVRL